MWRIYFHDGGARIRQTKNHPNNPVRSVHLLRLRISVATLTIALLVTTDAFAQQSTEELAKAAQNPVAAMISVPFQNNTNFDVGPYGRPQGILNIQPVIAWPSGVIGCHGGQSSPPPRYSTRGRADPL
jgi:hypothetical protein